METKFMEKPSLKQLMEAGVHFGHKKARSFPKSRPYTFGIREGIYIIDLEKTVAKLGVALKHLSKLSSEGKIILYVGTKYQGRKIIEEAAKSVNMPYVTERWYGGMLTNFDTIYANIKRLKKLEESRDTDAYKKLSKKEKHRIEEEIKKLNKNLSGIVNLNKIPDALLVFDVSNEKNAVTEAKKVGVQVIGICDTNANPEIIDYPIPANDDAIKSIEMITRLVTEAIAEGQKVTQKSQSQIESKISSELAEGASKKEEDGDK